MTDQHNKKCRMCKTKLTKNNISRRDTPTADIRLDCNGYRWCKECTEEHDNIDFGEVPYE